MPHCRQTSSSSMISYRISYERKRRFSKTSGGLGIVSVTWWETKGCISWNLQLNTDAIIKPDGLLESIHINAEYKGNYKLFLLRCSFSNCSSENTHHASNNWISTVCTMDLAASHSNKPITDCTWNYTESVIICNHFVRVINTRFSCQIFHLGEEKKSSFLPRHTHTHIDVKQCASVSLLARALLVNPEPLFGEM